MRLNKKRKHHLVNINIFTTKTEKLQKIERGNQLKKWFLKKQKEKK